MHRCNHENEGPVGGAACVRSTVLDDLWEPKEAKEADDEDIDEKRLEHNKAGSERSNVEEDVAFD